MDVNLKPEGGGGQGECRRDGIAEGPARERRDEKRERKRQS